MLVALAGVSSGEEIVVYERQFTSSSKGSGSRRWSHSSRRSEGGLKICINGHRSIPRGKFDSITDQITYHLFIRSEE